MLVKPLFAVVKDDGVKEVKEEDCKPLVCKQRRHMLLFADKKKLVRQMVQREETISQIADNVGVHPSILYCYCKKAINIMHSPSSKLSNHTGGPSQTQEHCEFLLGYLD